MTGAPVATRCVVPWATEILARLVAVGGAGAGVGDGVGDEVTTGGNVADEPERKTIMPLVSVFSLGPVSVAVIMSVVKVPAMCSWFPVLVYCSSAEKVAPETVPLKAIWLKPTIGTPAIPYSFQYAGSVE